MKLIDLTGKRFGRLVVLSRAETKRGQTFWNCKCDCGNIVSVNAYSLKIGETKSCGCLQKEIQSKNASKHNLSKTKLYKLFRRMHERCYNKNCKSYKDYGGRGIKICEEWLNDFKKFYTWAYENGYDSTKNGNDCSIDRIDVNGDYSPINCRWITKKQQANNRRNSRYITYNGETHTLAEWSNMYNISQRLLWARLFKLKWDIEKALTTLTKKVQ